MQTALYEIQNMTCNYGKKSICKGLSLQLREGTCNLILGDNGCGKTTLFSVICGLKNPKEGVFLWEGTEMPISKMQSKIGYVPQYNPLMPELTVWDNLLFWYGDKNTVKQQLETGMLQKLGLDEMLNLRVSKLSGGMARRCTIGCAMAGSPQLLVLDEPAASLDMECKRIWKSCMREYINQGGTILFSSHEETDRELADEIYRMQDGKLFVVK